MPYRHNLTGSVPYPPSLINDKLYDNLPINLQIIVKLFVNEAPGL